MNHPSVLIVEDDGLIALNLLQLLQKSGYNVMDPVCSGEEAIESVREFMPDLILMDIRLGGDIDGIETAYTIRQDFDIPVIFLSALSERDRLDRAKEITHQYFSKPFCENELLSAIKKVLSREYPD
jgi:two-component system, response regulator PdtaR